jgi:heme/copper-type cytochrome/quinol oxidase subunit 2
LVFFVFPRKNQKTKKINDFIEILLAGLGQPVQPARFEQKSLIFWFFWFFVRFFIIFLVFFLFFFGFFGFSKEKPKNQKNQ